MRLSIGAGPRRIEGFSRLDIDPACEPDILADIRKPLDLPDESVECLFCEEVISQLTPAECLGFLRECRRVLQPEGVMRVLTPDLARFCRAYLEQPDWLVEIWRRHVALPLLCDTAAEVLNAGLRGVGPFVYDRATLGLLAGRAGLVVHESAFNRSLHPAMCGIDLRPPEQTLTMYLELTRG